MDAIRALEARPTPNERVTLKLPPPTNPLPPANDPRSRQPGGASAEGGVDILGMDPLKPETLDFSKVPNPPTDVTFRIYRAGFACAIVFYYSMKLQRQFRPFWNGLNQGWKAYYRKALSSDQLVHPPQRDDIAYTAKEIKWCTETRKLMIQNLTAEERDQRGMATLSKGRGAAVTTDAAAATR